MAVSEWWQNYLDRCEEEKYKALRKLKGICKDLYAREIAEVFVEYDGYGDSGSIESIQTFRKDGGDAPELSDDERRIVEDAVYLVLPMGWENNEGGVGDVTVSTKEKKLVLNHGYRETVVHYEDEEIELPAPRRPKKQNSEGEQDASDSTRGV